MKHLKPFAVEALLLIVLGVLSFSALNPYFMPMGVQFAVISVLIVLFGVFVVFVWRENGGDEREVANRHRSDRFAFLAGATILLIAVVYESVFHRMESPWVIAALSVMVLAKVLASIYHQKNY